MAAEEAPGAQRLEAFSDGVFAVAITLLALDLRAPELASASSPALLHALLAHWPAYLGVLNSFASVLLLWNTHRLLLRYVARHTVPLLLANGLLLLLVTGSAFVTGTMSRYLLTAAAPAATALYAGYSAVLSASVLLLWVVIRRGGLLRPGVPVAYVHRIGYYTLVSIPYYVAMAVLACWQPVTAVLLSNASWIYWAAVLSRVEQAGGK